MKPETLLENIHAKGSCSLLELLTLLHHHQDPQRHVMRNVMEVTYNIFYKEKIVAKRKRLISRKDAFADIVIRGGHLQVTSTPELFDTVVAGAAAAVRDQVRACPARIWKAGTPKPYSDAIDEGIIKAVVEQFGGLKLLDTRQPAEVSRLVWNLASLMALKHRLSTGGGLEPEPEAGMLLA